MRGCGSGESIPSDRVSGTRLHHRSDLRSLWCNDRGPARPVSSDVWKAPHGMAEFVIFAKRRLRVRVNMRQYLVVCSPKRLGFFRCLHA